MEHTEKDVLELVERIRELLKQARGPMEYQPKEGEFCDICGDSPNAVGTRGNA